MAWDAKRAYDTVRPITAIRYYFQGQMIRSWGGPGQGAVWLRGEDWKSAAMRWTCASPSRRWPCPSIRPCRRPPVTLAWTSLAAAADSAGLSRRLGSIHFERGDRRGRRAGRLVGAAVLNRCLDLFNDGGACN